MNNKFGDDSCLNIEQINDVTRKILNEIKAPMGFPWIRNFLGLGLIEQKIIAIIYSELSLILTFLNVWIIFGFKIPYIDDFPASKKIIFYYHFVEFIIKITGRIFSPFSYQAFNFIGIRILYYSEKRGGFENISSDFRLLALCRFFRCGILAWRMKLIWN